MTVPDYEVKLEDQGKLLDWLERVADQIREGRIVVRYLTVNPLSNGSFMEQVATITWIRFADEDGRKARRQKCDREWRKANANG